MGARQVVALILAGLLIAGPGATRAQSMVIVASGLADDLGNCVVDIPVDPGIDPHFVADQLKEHLLLSSGAQPQLISVENGIAHIECIYAPPGAAVEGWLPPDVAVAIGAKGEVPDGEVSRYAIAGGVVLGLVGLGLGLCVALGCFDDDDDDQLRTVRGNR